jgi:hypothetical protein
LKQWLVAAAAEVVEAEEADLAKTATLHADNIVAVHQTMMPVTTARHAEEHQPKAAIIAAKSGTEKTGSVATRQRRNARLVGDDFACGQKSKVSIHRATPLDPTG